MQSNSLMNAEAWQQYRSKLRRFIASRDSGMLLDADEEYEHRFGEPSGGRAGFKLQNGQVVKKFITIWELFDHGVAFKECIEKLALKAAEIRQRVNFSKIITATPTAEELCEHVFDLLKRDGAGVELSAYHFGDYPITPLANSSFGQFKDEKVLILTDIISTGNLVKNMAESIAKQGGQVVSILSIAITKQDWIQHQYETDNPPRIQLNSNGARLHNLTDYRVLPLSESAYDVDKLIPIDYSSVLPENGRLNNQQYSPIFTLSETFEHLEQAKALDFAFYKFDDCYRTCALIIPKLLETYQSEIWNRIRNPILSATTQAQANQNGLTEQTADDELLLVTTYKRKDILFKNFIERCLDEENINTATGITLKRSVKDLPSRNLTLGARGQEIKGKEVILVLATLSTTERLRNLVSLLVSCEVKKITVICLFNEMGPFTTGFINAIERFTKRVKTTNLISSENECSFTDFSFHMLYSFLDIDNDDIAKMHKEIDWLFSQFNNRTKVPAFNRLTKRIKGYFQSHKYAERNYTDSEYSLLKSPYSLANHCDTSLIDDQEVFSISVQTQEAKIALMTYNLALYRNFKPVLEEFSNAFRRKTFIHLYGLILSDIHYLQFTKLLNELQKKILLSLDRIYQEYFKLENEELLLELQQDKADPVETKISPIAYLLFGLGIISYYDSRENLNNISIKDLLFCQKTPEEWINSHSKFMWEYFSDERIPYFISFLLHSLYPRLPQVSRQEKGTIEELNATISRFKRAFFDYYQTLDDQSSSLLKSKIQLINNNLDTILIETGKYERREKHQTIRYLHREVLRPKEGHNPIFTNLLVLIRELEDYFADKSDNNSDRLFQMTEKILARLDDALSGTASLSIISEAVRQLFYFTPSKRAERERYTNLASQDDSFTKDTEDLVDILTLMRSRRSFSKENCRNLRMLLRRIREDFYDSKLRDALQDYVIPLNGLLAKTLLEVNERLNKEGFQDILRSYYEFYASQDNKNNSPLVLCDYYLLQETLRNIFYNLRHSFPIDIRHSLSNNVLRVSSEKTSFNVKPENQRQDAVTLELFVRGTPPSTEDLLSPEKTISDQLFKLQEFGAQWELVSNKEIDAFTLRLIFLSRDGYPYRSEETSSLN